MLGRAMPCEDGGDPRCAERGTGVEEPNLEMPHANSRGPSCLWRMDSARPEWAKSRAKAKQPRHVKDCEASATPIVKKLRADKNRPSLAEWHVEGAGFDRAKFWGTGEEPR